MQIFRKGLLALLCTLAACGGQPTQPSVASSSKARRSVLTEDQTQRRAFILAQVQVKGGDRKNVLTLKNVNDVVSAVESGRVTLEQMKGIRYFFTDPNPPYWEDIGLMFSCIGVVRLETEGDVPVYRARYLRPEMNIGVTVIWGGVEPLKGQRLNVDYLEFSGTSSFETTDGKEISTLEFIRPFWAAQ